MSRRTHLKYAGISTRTLALYEHEVSQFLSHLQLHGLRPPRSYRRLDQAVANYINHLYQEGETLTKAGWLLSGIRRLYPRMKKELAISQLWYNNWCPPPQGRCLSPGLWSKALWDWPYTNAGQQSP